MVSYNFIFKITVMKVVDAYYRVMSFAYMAFIVKKSKLNELHEKNLENFELKIVARVE